MKCSSTKPKPSPYMQIPRSFTSISLFHPRPCENIRANTATPEETSPGTRLIHPSPRADYLGMQNLNAIHELTSTHNRSAALTLWGMLATRPVGDRHAEKLRVSASFWRKFPGIPNFCLPCRNEAFSLCPWETVYLEVGSLQSLYVEQVYGA